MAKAPDAFRTISEVAELLDTPAHVLRFWESKFAQVKPVKRAGGRRYYRPDDVALLGGIKTLLHDQGMTIKGAQKVLRDRGVKAVTDMGRPPEGEVIDAVALAPAPAQHPEMSQDSTPADPPQDEDLPLTDAPADADERDAPQDDPQPDSDTPTDDAEPSTDDVGAAPAPVTQDHSPATPPRKLAITEIAFVTDPEAAADNVVPLPRHLAPSAAQDNAVAAPAPPVLPDLPRPRPITGSRLLGTLARMDRAQVTARTPALAPLLDRLAQAHDRLTGR